MDKNIITILIIGIILRLALAFTTFHSDLTAFQFAGNMIASGHVLDFYDYDLTLDKKFQDLALFNYPPAIYLFSGFFNLIFAHLLGMSFINNYVFDHLTLSQDFLFNLHLLILKLPYFLFDIPAAFLLTKFFTNKKEKLLAFAMWMFNPIGLHASFMMGQYDVIPTFLVLLALYLAYRKKLELGVLSLGLGAAFKIFPLFLIFPLAAMGKTWSERFKLIGLGFVPYILFILPYLPSHGFRSTALVASQTTKSLFSQIPISGAESVYIYLAVLIFYFLVIFIYKKPTFINLWRHFFIVMLFFYIFTHTHPQWFLWLTPFLIMDLIDSKFKNWPVFVLSIFTWLAALFFFDPGLNIGLFGPVTGFYDITVSIWQLLGLNIDYNFSRSIIQTLFVGGALYYIYHSFKQDPDLPS
jgi:hypothetical protein